MDVLGLTALHGPAAACLVRDGRVIAAVREDALSGRSEDSRVPGHAITYCLRAGKIGAAHLHAVLVAGPLDVRASGQAYPETRKGGSAIGRLRRLFGRRDTLRDLLRAELDGAPAAIAVDPALAEAAATHFTSPFPDTAVLVLDGPQVIRVGTRGGRLEVLGTGAAGSDVGAAAEQLLEECGTAALGLAGPGAQDRAANGRLLARGFARLWIHPATGGGAAALGAALLGWRDASGGGTPDARIASGAGPVYNAAQIRTFLRSQGLTPAEPERDEAPRRAAALLAEGHRVAWFDGRLDFGEETAGSRAVLRAPSVRHPADAAADETLAVAAERIPELFTHDGPCPPLVDLPVREAMRETLRAPSVPSDRVPVTPVGAEHRGFRALLAAFEQLTGCPALVARPLRRLNGVVAASPNDAWEAREREPAAALVLGPYVVTGAPLTGDATARDSREPTSSPEIRE